jgi:hypothetical protein
MVFINVSDGEGIKIHVTDRPYVSQKRMVIKVVHDLRFDHRTLINRQCSFEAIERIDYAPNRG